MKTKQTLGWMLFFTGTLFLVCGLVVMLFATLRPGVEGPNTGIPDPSFWASLANAVMGFIIELLEVEWTPTRVGVFLIIVGIFLDGGGMYAIFSSDRPTKRRSSRRKSRRK